MNAMQVLISRHGHEHPYHHMIVDNHGIPIDLRDVQGSLVDPAILFVTWGIIRDDYGIPCEGGLIMRRGEKDPKKYYDKGLLTPYLVAYEKRKAELLEYRVIPGTNIPDSGTPAY